ncbi:5-formyltetrahydrofolate cyclo-ligase [Saccharomonospora halophila]|uniref:5-formyltetrahydrofolate cyclo-ligase n=1 Tax=Saccharomonospora halophila TaxID=129922 RepID=UPI0003751E33|nr:5-formyltetrahydrofolate cyclo-ligase [Saccharomonospora halophila]
MTHTDNDSPLEGVKTQWRRSIQASRTAVTAQQQVSESSRLVAAVGGLDAGVVCCYVPYGSEPGSLALLDRLREQGSRRGEFMPVLEPRGPRLGPEAVADADVDKRGVRLGKGAGYYDRSLVLTSPGTDLIAVIRDAELVDELPAEPHDVRMHAVLTPDRGLHRLP